MRIGIAIVTAAAGLLSAQASAKPENFTRGPVLLQGGGVAKVASDVPLPPGMTWKMDFDVPIAAPGKINPHIDAAARYINMLAASGVPMSKIQVALVVRSNGLLDLLEDASYGRETDGQSNPNLPVLKEMIAKGVPVYVCGQSAELLDVSKSEMVPGVKMALSALTMHTMLQSQGYAIEP